jgi:hypothetical protein
MSLIDIPWFSGSVNDRDAWPQFMMNWRGASVVVKIVLAQQCQVKPKGNVHPQTFLWILITSACPASAAALLRGRQGD